MNRSSTSLTDTDKTPARSGQALGSVKKTGPETVDGASTPPQTSASQTHQRSTATDGDWSPARQAVSPTRRAASSSKRTPSRTDVTESVRRSPRLMARHDNLLLESPSDTKTNVCPVRLSLSLLFQYLLLLSVYCLQDYFSLRCVQFLVVGYSVDSVINCYKVCVWSSLVLVCSRFVKMLVLQHV